MARVTVEDCVLRIPNRFELVMLASQRARDISAGTPLTIDRDNDKNPVIALREIADDTVAPDALTESLLRGLQRHAESDEPEEEQMALPQAIEDVSPVQPIEPNAREADAAGIQVIDVNADDGVLDVE